MLTTSIAAGIAKVLAAQFLAQLGVDARLRGILQVPVDQLVGRTERKAAQATLDKLALLIANELLAFPRALEDNAGAAAAAADSFLASLEASNLSARTLVELDLKPDRIAQHLLLASKPFVEGASAERRGQVERAIRQLSLQLVAHAPSLPGVQLAFMQVLLERSGSNQGR
jgi:hypothetical protein